MGRLGTTPHCLEVCEDKAVWTFNLGMDEEAKDLRTGQMFVKTHWLRILIHRAFDWAGQFQVGDRLDVLGSVRTAVDDDGKGSIVYTHHIVANRVCKI